MPDSVVANTKQEFDLHMAALTDTQKLLLENTAKVTGFLLLALGWLATSKDARDFLTTNHGLAMIFVVAIFLAYLMAAGFMWTAYRACEQTYRRLLELAFVPESAYEVRKPHPLVFGACILGNGVLLVPLGLFVLTS